MENAPARPTRTTTQPAVPEPHEAHRMPARMPNGTKTTAPAIRPGTIRSSVRRRRPGSLTSDIRHTSRKGSSRDGSAGWSIGSYPLAKHHDPTRADRVPVPIGLDIDPDPRAVGHHDVLVQYGPPHGRALADSHARQQHAA